MSFLSFNMMCTPMFNSQLAEERAADPRSHDNHRLGGTEPCVKSTAM